MVERRTLTSRAGMTPRTGWTCLASIVLAVDENGPKGWALLAPIRAGIPAVDLAAWEPLEELPPLRKWWRNMESEEAEKFLLDSHLARCPEPLHVVDELAPAIGATSSWT